MRRENRTCNHKENENGEVLAATWVTQQHGYL